MIAWILGSTTAIGLGGVVVLAVYVVIQSRSNRGDLLRLTELTEENGALRRDQDTLQRSITDLNHALNEKTKEADRERAATTAAQEALHNALEQLAATGTSAGAVASLRGALDRLRQLSTLQSTGDTDSHGAGSVHGSAASDHRETGSGDRDP